LPHFVACASIRCHSSLLSVSRPHVRTLRTHARTCPQTRHKTNVVDVYTPVMVWVLASTHTATIVRSCTARSVTHGCDAQARRYPAGNIHRSAVDSIKRCSARKTARKTKAMGSW
jgi:hypothetical protein